jgi:general secretion pathway protein F
LTVYRYSGYDADGRSVAGTIESPSERGVLERLAGDGIIPVEVSSDGTGAAQGTATLRHAPRRRWGRVSATTRVLFVRELATFLHADIPLLEALGVLRRQETSPRFRAILTDVHDRVQGGEAFSSALARHGQAFPPLLVSMVRVGETGGMLGGVLDQMAGWMEHEEEVRGEIRGALAYPLVVVTLGILTLIVLTGFVLPQIAGIFAGMEQELPLATRVLLAGAAFMGRWWWLVVLALAAVVVGIRQTARTGVGGRLLDRVSLGLPIFGGLVRKASIARLARASAALLGSGVPLLETLRVVRGLMTNSLIREVVEQAIGDVTRGQSLAHSLEKSPLFPSSVTHLIAVGERTGRLGEMFDRVARTFERQTRAQIKVMLELLAPGMIVLLAVMVGAIAIAVLMPIMQLNQLMR